MGYILGISCWYHDSAACLLRDGEIVAAAQEERFTRQKHDPGFPRNAISFCLTHAGIRASDLEAVAFYDKPFLKFERLLETYLSYAPRGLRSFSKAMPLWLKLKLWIPDLLERELDFDGTILFPEHHESHAASAFFPSPFSSAAFLTTDGVGEWATASWGTGADADIEIRQEIHFPHSLGLLYSAFTYFCGFRVNSGEYKLMGLAPYGEPTYVQAIRDNLIDIRPDGSFRLNMQFFTYAAGLTMTGRRFAELFGGRARDPESPLTQREMDLARSVQEVTEEAIMKMAHHIHRETQEPRLCLAGGVALNCVANGRLLREGPFTDLWIQPAAGDAGGALGAALMAHYDYSGANRRVAEGDSMQGSRLGPSFSDDEVEEFLDSEDVRFRTYSSAELYEVVAQLLDEGNVVGWFQGRMEFGPRALGGRSILADPRGRDVQRKVNLKIKYRESFRPFAPSVAEDQAADYFDFDDTSPYMLMVAPVRNASISGEGLERLSGIDSPIPAVTHVDGSARLQTVDEVRNPEFFHLLKAFERRTGCPVLVNTSFNVRGEPIVCTPLDALNCFRRTHMDVLVLGHHVVRKDDGNGVAAADDLYTLEEIAAKYGLD
ncbi:MAG: carbamoyltransferase [Rhodothermia bacterium]|nr:carbamoyltransferase [Rhodothermia bacterium]